MGNEPQMEVLSRNRFKRLIFCISEGEKEMKVLGFT